MNLNKTFIRGCLLYDFKSGLNAAESSRCINAAFGEGTVSERNARFWFQRFHDGNFDLEDRPRAGRPSTVDRDRLQQVVEADPRMTARELAETLGVHNSTVINHLHALGMVSKLQQWVPHNLSEENKQRRAEAATSLLSYRRTNDWLNSIITGDEKWCLYVNVKRKRNWLRKDSPPQFQAKAELHSRKVMLCVWWDSQGIILSELLPQGTTITADLYCQQLQRLAEKIAETRPQHGVVRFLHDNARPHVAKATRQKLIELGWEVLPHPPYSPDLAPSDYHLFRALSHAIEGKSFANEEELEAWIRDFFDSRPHNFYRDGIKKLPERWQKVVDANGDYFL